MKLFALTFFLMLPLAHARQYIQCANENSWDRAVINLNGDKSTLFLTDGVHNPDEIRVLKKLFFVSANDQMTVYETNEGEVKELVQIPTQYIGSVSRSFNIVLEMKSDSHGVRVQMNCFSALYED